MSKHIWTPGIDEVLSVEKELRNLHDNFGISVVKNEPYAGAWSRAQHTPAIILEPAFITVQNLRPTALKQDLASKRNGSYLRQYDTFIYALFHGWASSPKTKGVQIQRTTNKLNETTWLINE